MTMQLLIFFQMLTIDNIEFNRDIYQHAQKWAVLLYQLNRIGIAIPIPNANEMRFVQVFHDLPRCADWIQENSGKSITLFVYDENFQQWLNRNSPIPNNIRNIKIFCHPDDQRYLTLRISRYRQRYATILFEIITFDNLNYELLSLGLEHIQSLRQEFRHVSERLNLLDHDYQQIIQSLSNHVLNSVNIEFGRIRLSEEEQSSD